jgi:O-antigen/teichoic acid export membrane protein
MKFDFIKQKELVKYLLPLTFHVLGLVMMNSIDRIFLANMLGLEVTGLYTIAYTMGATLGIVHDALLKVWSPEFYKRIKTATTETKIKILKFQYLYIIGSFFMFGVFLVVYPYIFHLMVNEKFNSALNIIPIIALGLTFESLRKLFIGYHYNLGKNTRIAILTLVAGIANAVFNYILIPKYGVEGAAYATLISYILVVIITIIDVDRLEKINWRLKNE